MATAMALSSGDRPAMRVDGLVLGGLPQRQLTGQHRVADRLGVDGDPVEVADAPEPVGQLPGEFLAEQGLHLAVAVLLGYVDALVAGDELSHRWMQGQAADSEGGRLHPLNGGL